MKEVFSLPFSTHVSTQSRTVEPSLTYFCKKKKKKQRVNFVKSFSLSHILSLFDEAKNFESTQTRVFFFFF